MNLTEIRNERTQLLNYLWDFQKQNGYISTSDIKKLSQELGISWIEIEGVISFYHFFKRKPTGKYTIYLNNSMISELKGFHKIKEAFEKETETSFGTTDATGTFSLFETACIGLSDQEPAALINFKPVINLTPKKVKEIIGRLKKGGNLDEIEDTPKDRIIYKNDKGEAVLFRDYNEGEAVMKLIKKRPEEVIEEIKESGLSGRGGAFFPTGLKWEFAKQSHGLQKYVICNADEGEPGTFKDRVLINQLPGLLIEGMITGAYAVGASKGIIYLRAEYRYLRKKLENTINRFYKIGLLGENILGKNFDFDLSIMQGAGAYVCGEETALIESLEGHRGGPRTKVYFPVEKGYLEKPTVVNNVETFCVAARIMEYGSVFYSSKGTAKTKGTKLLSISGDCNKPGIYEIEWGMTIQEMLDLCEAKDTNYIQFSGPSGTVLTKKDFKRKISGEDLICGGSVMIFNSKVDIFDILTNFSNFFIAESCGLCTPCRAGNYLIGKRLERIKNNDATMEEIEEIKGWSKVLKDTSRCGLGKTSTNFITDAIEKFPDLFKKKALKHKEFDLSAALNDYYDTVKNN
ncbi:MAG: NAD(P)H-dependent oxidoreductase subunit E [Bacteroidales bacterium]|nr:NAD(P)H-dependent oxidoreductase subunit E [Bacteroidales bacterium]